MKNKLFLCIVFSVMTPGFVSISMVAQDSNNQSEETDTRGCCNNCNKNCSSSCNKCNKCCNKNCNKCCKKCCNKCCCKTSC